MQLVIDVYVKEKDCNSIKIIHETLDEFEILQIMQNKINDYTDKYLVNSINIVQINT